MFYNYVISFQLFFLFLHTNYLPTSNPKLYNFNYVIWHQIRDFPSISNSFSWQLEHVKLFSQTPENLHSKLGLVCQVTPPLLPIKIYIFLQKKLFSHTLHPFMNRYFTFLTKLWSLNKCQQKLLQKVSNRPHKDSLLLLREPT